MTSSPIWDWAKNAKSMQVVWGIMAIFLGHCWSCWGCIDCWFCADLWSMCQLMCMLFVVGAGLVGTCRCLNILRNLHFSEILFFIQIIWLFTCLFNFNFKPLIPASFSSFIFWNSFSCSCPGEHNVTNITLAVAVVESQGWMAAIPRHYSEERLWRMNDPKMSSRRQRERPNRAVYVSAKLQLQSPRNRLYWSYYIIIISQIDYFNHKYWIRFNGYHLHLWYKSAKGNMSS